MKSAESLLLSRTEAAGLGEVARKVFARERLTRADGALLDATPDLHTLNYTNLCNKLRIRSFEGPSPISTASP